MQVSADVMCAIEELRLATRQAEEVERVATEEQVRNGESSMGNTESIKVFFRNIIMPEFEDTFWANVPQQLRTPTNALRRTDEIIGEIQTMILTRISEDRFVDAHIRNWLLGRIGADSRIQILTNRNNPNHERVLVEAIGYLNSVRNVDMAAWRVFVLGYQQTGHYIKLLSPPISGVNDYNEGLKIECRQMLAYYYLVAIDEGQTPTSPDYPTSASVIEHRKVNLIGQLADICRAHSYDRDALDAPSCYPGTIGRLARMGVMHPVAQLPSSVAEQLPNIINSIVARTVDASFAGCVNYREKVDLYVSIMNFTCQNVDDIRTGVMLYDSSSLRLRNNFILTLANTGGGNFTTTDAAIYGIIEEISRTLSSGDLGRLIPNIMSELLARSSKVRAMILNCGEYEAMAIRNGFLTSLSQAEREQWNRANPDLTQESQESVVVETLLEAYNRAREGVIQTIGRMPEPLRARMNTIQGINRRTIDQIISDERFLSIWRIATRSEDENRAALEQEIGRLQQLSQPVQQSVAPIMPTIVPVMPHVAMPVPIVPPVVVPVPGGNPAGYNPANEALLGPAMQAPLRYTPNLGALHIGRLHANAVQIAGPYSATQALPSLPAIHPYNPTDGGIRDGGIARFSLATILPTGTITNLPAGVREFLIQQNINMANVTCAISIQNKPWQDVPLLFRPQAWLHQDAPQVGVALGYNRASNIRVSMAQVGGRFGELRPFDVSTHGGPGAGVVFSPNNMQILGLRDNTNTDTFYSVCIEPAQGVNPTRAIITLHSLLSVADQINVDSAMQRMLAQSEGMGDHGASLTLENFIVQLWNEERPVGINTEELHKFASGINIVPGHLVDSAIRIHDAVPITTPVVPLVAPAQVAEQAGQAQATAAAQAAERERQARAAAEAERVRQTQVAAAQAAESARVAAAQVAERERQARVTAAAEAERVRQTQVAAAQAAERTRQAQATAAAQAAERARVAEAERVRAAAAAIAAARTGGF